jgi:GH15 family glucan-1,4-alpha-glucosidase
LSDCETGALVSVDGNVEWLCLPRFDSPSAFGAMLDRDAGGFRLGPPAGGVPAARRYLPGTLILETTWECPEGWLVVRDLLLLGPWRDERGRSQTQRRPPTDHRAEHVLLRLARCIDGEVELRLDCEPLFDYGRRPARWEYVGSGYQTAQAASAEGEPPLRLVTDLRLGLEGSRATARSELVEGGTAFAALAWSDGSAPSSFTDAERRFRWTARYWRGWLQQGRFPDHPWRPYLQRSALTLKGLSYAPTGALLAAATTSLPEEPGGERNWDYRYCWIRDSTLMLWAFHNLGLDREADDFFAFLTDVAEGSEGDLQVVYGLGGESELEEVTLGHLSGYENSRPVRVGNAAYRQNQNDVWGAFVDSVYVHASTRDELTERLWTLVVRQVETALERWRLPDRGVWEMRSEPRHFTSSKLMCWLACDRGARLAELRGELTHAARWQSAAEEIRQDMLANALDKRGVFCQHYEATALDASLLMLPLVRFLPPEDERVRTTVMAIARELTVDGFVLRYRHEIVDDGLAGEEATFTTCSFALVSALVEIGQPGAARQLLEHLLAHAGPLQLYAEELDPFSGRQFGNFPQALTHVALINAVLRVVAAEQAFKSGVPLEHALASLRPGQATRPLP